MKSARILLKLLLNNTQQYYIVKNSKKAQHVKLGVHCCRQVSRHIFSLAAVILLKTARNLSRSVLDFNKFYECQSGLNWRENGLRKRTFS